MIEANETFNGTWPFEPKFHTVPATGDAASFEMHYVDEGPRDGEVLVCLHGEPTWGYLYRNMIPRLSERYRVIVPDHMGFGKTETPQDRTYTLKTHVDNFATLVDTLDLRDITLVIQDWGGPIGTQYTVRNADRVKRLFYANTVNGFGMAGRDDLPQINDSNWFRWIGGGIENGRTEAVLRNLGSTVLSVMKIIGFENSAAVDDTWIDAYSAPFTAPEECIGAHEFPLDAFLARFVEYMLEGAAGVEQLKAKPAMLAEGMCDKAIPPEIAIADFEATWPEGVIVRLPNVGHFCQEDAPETLVSLIDAFVQTHRG
jgi:haloalkane dehalogenase